MPISVHRPGRLRVLQLLNSFKYPQPDYLAGRIALSREGISPLHRLNGGGLPVLVHEQLGYAVDVEVGGQSSVTTAQ